MIANRNDFDDLVNAAEAVARMCFGRALVEIDSAEIAVSVDTYALNEAQADALNALAARFLAAMHRGYELSGQARVGDLVRAAKLNPENPI